MDVARLAIERRDQHLVDEPDHLVADGPRRVLLAIDLGSGLEGEGFRIERVAARLGLLRSEGRIELVLDERVIEVVRRDGHDLEVHRLQRPLQLRYRPLVARGDETDGQLPARKPERQQAMLPDDLRGDHGEDGGARLVIGDFHERHGAPGKRDRRRSCHLCIGLRRFSRRRLGSRAKGLGHHHFGEGDLGAIDRAQPRELRREPAQERLGHRRGPEDGLRFVPADPEDAAGILGEDRVRARAVAEDGCLAERFAGTEAFDLGVRGPDDDLAREDDSHSFRAGACADQLRPRPHLERDEERREAGDVLAAESLEERGAGEERLETGRRDAGDEDSLDGRCRRRAAAARLGGPAACSRLDFRHMSPCGRDSRHPAGKRISDVSLAYRITVLRYGAGGHGPDRATNPCTTSRKRAASNGFSIFVFGTCS